jgi:soluble cytochrome b562
MVVAKNQRAKKKKSPVRRRKVGSTGTAGGRSSALGVGGATAAAIGRAAGRATVEGVGGPQGPTGPIPRPQGPGPRGPTFQGASAEAIAAGEADPTALTTPIENLSTSGLTTSSPELGTPTLTEQNEIFPPAVTQQSVGVLDAVEAVDTFSANVEVSTRIRIIARRLSEQKIEIRDAARSFATAIKEQAENLRKQHNKISERDRGSYNDLIDFLDVLAHGLDELANALNQLSRTTAASEIGRAAQIVQNLQDRVGLWLAKNIDRTISCTTNVAILIGGIGFLHAMSADDPAAITALTTIILKRGPK